MYMIVVSQYFQYSYVVVHFNLSNLWILTDCLGLALMDTLALLKLFLLVVKPEVKLLILILTEKKMTLLETVVINIERAR